MKTLNRSQALAATLIVILFCAFLFAQMVNNDVLYTLSPWIQRFFTDFGESERLYSHSTMISSGDLVLPHASFLRTSTHLVAEGGAIDSFVLFQFGSILLRVFYVILIMMITIVMTGKIQYALVMGIMVFSSAFFVFRSHMFVPQNVAVLFFLSMIWGFEKYRQSGRLLFLSVVMLSLLGNVFYDPTSLIISGIIILSYTVHFLINGDIRKIEFTYFSLLICVILLIPWFETLIGIVVSTFSSFGDNSIWSQATRGTSEPLPPIINTYFELIGYPVSIFASLGVVAILRQGIRRYGHLLVMAGLMLLLTVNVSPNLALSPGRMQDYLYIPLLLIASVYVAVLFTRTGRLVRMALISILVAFGLAIMIDTPPRIQLDSSAIKVTNEVDTLLSADPNATVYVEAEAMITTMLLRSPEQICAYWDSVFQWYRQPISGEPPDCTQATYRIVLGNRDIQHYEIIDPSEPTDVYSLYARSSGE
jgi:hypothetical protein